MIRKIWLIAALLAPTMLRADTTPAPVTMTASWYGEHWEGRRTACGCRFRAAGYTAASRSLPFGTLLRVERGDRSVLVVINDRGPYIAGRQLDLSKAAAEALGMRDVGVARVQVQIIGHQAGHLCGHVIT